MAGVPRFAITNDDGVDAPGIVALARAAEEFGRAITIAPAGPQSGCGHKVTTDDEFAISDRGKDRYAVDGTPADCVRLAVHHFGGPIDWVLSGINAGGNLGLDLQHSGTVAAVREAAVYGIPAIAFSQYMAKGRGVDWSRAEVWTARILKELLTKPTPPETFWNVNLPHPADGAAEPRIVYCSVDPSPLPVKYRVEAGKARYIGEYQSRERRVGWDIDVCFRGDIAVSLVHVMSSVDRFE